MDNKGKALIAVVVLGGAALWAFSRKGEEIKNVTVNIDERDVNAKFSYPNVLISLKLTAYNPNTNPVQFQKFLGNIYYNNAIISNIDATKPILIPARSSVKIPASVSIPAVKLGANILNILNKILDKSKVTIKVKGILYIENMRVSIDHNIELNLTK